MVMLSLAWALAVAVAVPMGRADATLWFPNASLAGQVYFLMSVLAVAVLMLNGDYSRRNAFWEEVLVAWRTVGLAAIASFALNFFLQVSFSRTVPLLAWVLAIPLLPMGRLLAREWMIPAGYWRRRALVVGEGRNAQEAVSALNGERNVGVLVAGVSSFSGDRVQVAADEHPDLIDEYSGIPSHLFCDGVESLAKKLGCEVIVVALDDETRGRAAPLVRSLHAQQFEVFIVPALEGLPVQGLQAQQFFSNDLLFLRLQHKLLNPIARRLKRGVDLVLASAAIVVLSPLMAWVAWRIWREDGGPVLFGQMRVGEGGQDFRFIKFRSMVQDADAILESWKTDEPRLFADYVDSNFKLLDDPRVLGVGRWIRRTSIDELPQLWNVLRGEMSLVGPRPLLRRELAMYAVDAMELYEQVKPGITGLWQVSGRSQTTFAQRASLDSWYVRNWSLWVDVVILLKTVRVVLTARGAM
jgi:Undecaprenyl-phosphate galactose phosphotransferase WbaP